MNISFTFPHILIQSAKVGDFIQASIREGATMSVARTTVAENSEVPIETPSEFFSVRATNQINFGGRIISVLNDANEALGIPESSPSATEYLALIGQPVLIGFRCDKMARGGYKITRSTIILK